MSKTIDERVLEMRFDNKQFESGVATSMSTLDKLKQKLNLTGASKGLEGLSRASKNVDFSGMTKGIETVNARFSAMQVIGVTALANITNSAINAGKRMVSALTIDPIKTGFQEYETQINAVQTILSNTQKEGTNVQIVNKALDELNAYADKTIYNFTEMTRNIGTFTAAGVKLETSVNAIQGIANLAAMSGSTSQQASTAMYQLSQALASGTVKLMDWNSVVNAGMGGQLFQDALKETSRLLGTGADAAIEASGSFRDSLSTGWLTAEVLTETLKKFTTSGANEYVAEYTGLSKEAVQSALDEAEARYGEAEAIDKASEALANKSGKNKEEIKSALEFAKSAEDAATKVKTFTQFWDVLKESAQSGWAQTWRAIFGDFEEAKAFWSDVSTTLSDIIGKFNDFRNTIVDGALGKTLNVVGDSINKIISPAKKVEETVNKVSESFANLDEMASKVIRGDFGNGQERFDKLTESGQNYMRIQNKVNETLGSSYRYTQEQIEAQDKLIGKQKEATESTKENTTANKENSESVATLTEENKRMLLDMAKLGYGLESSGKYTKEQVEAFRELESAADDLGVPINDLIENINNLSGRFFLLNGIKNIGRAIAETFKAIGDGWTRVFGNFDKDGAIEGLFNATISFSKLTAALIPTEEEAEKLSKIFGGLFAAIDMVSTIVGGGIKIAFKVAKEVLSVFGVGLLDILATIGEAVISFRKWVFEENALSKSINGLIKKLPSLVSKFKEWFSIFKDTPAVNKFIESIEKIQTAFSKLTRGKIDIGSFAKTLGQNLASALTSLPSIAMQIGRDFIAGFQNGIGDSISGVIDRIISFCLNFVSAFAEALGVQSPSWKAYDIMVDFFNGAINGAKAMIGSLIGVFEKIGGQIVKVFKSFWDFITDESGNIKWGNILAGGVVVAMAWSLKQLATAFSGIANALGGLDDLLGNASKVLKSFSKVLNSISWDIKAKALQKMAISIAILVASIWLLTKIDDPAKLWNAVGVIAVLAGILVILAVAMDKMSQASVSIGKSGANLKGLKTGLLQIGIVLLLLAATVKIISGMDIEEAKQGFKGLAALAVGMVVFLAAIGKISSYTKDVSKLGGMMIKLSVAMLLMVGVCKLVGMLSAEDMLRGGAFATAFVVFVGLLGVAARIAGPNANEFSKMAIKMSIAMLLMVGVCKLVGTLSAEEMLQGAAFAGAFIVFVGLLGLCTRIAEKEIPKLGGMLLSMSVAMLLMVGVCKLAGMLSAEEMAKGAAFALGVVALVKIMVSILKIGNEQQMARVAGTILAMSAAIAILAGVAILLGFVDIGSLAKGLTAVGLLGLIMSVMVKSLKGAQNVKGSIMMMSIAIAVMVGSVVALSFIDPSKLAGATAALGIIMGMFALIEHSSKNVTKSIASLAVMVIAVGLLATILYILSNNINDVGSAVAASASLSVLMLTLAASLSIVGKIGDKAMKAMPAVYAMSGVVAILAVILGALSSLNIGSTIENATSLSILLLSLSASMLIISKTGEAALAAMPAALAMSGIIALLAGILWALSALNVGPTLEIAASLSMLLLSLSAACLIMAGAAAIATFASAGLLPMMALIIGMGALMASIAGLVVWVPDLESFLSQALPILKLIGQGIGEFLGGIVSGFAGATLDILPKFGAALSGFMVGVQPFVMLSKNIDSSVLTGVSYLSGAILALTAANFISGVGQFLSFGQSFADLGKQLSDFIINAAPFLTMIQTVDPASIESANTLAKMILTLTAADLISGITSFLGGSVNFADFGTQLVSFGKSMVEFSNAVSGNIDTEAINAAANAGQAMSKLANSIPKSDGFLQDIVGESDLAKFGTMCKAFGKAIQEMSASLTGENGTVLVNDAAIESAVKAGKGMSKVANAIPKSDGFLQDIVGESDLAKFGTTCKAFGKAIREMSQSLTGEDGSNVINDVAIESAVKAGKAMSKLANAIPKSDGFLQDIIGESDLAKFGKTCKAFGDAIKAMSDSLGGGEDSATINIAYIDTAIEAGKKMTKLVNSLPEEGIFDGKMNLTEFSDYISDFGKAISGFSENITNVNTEGINSAITAANRIKALIQSLSGLDISGVAVFTGIGVGGIGADGAVSDIAKAIADFCNKTSDIDAGKLDTTVSAARSIKSLISSLVGLDTSGISTFSTAINELASINISGFVNAFSNASGQLTTAGINMINAIITGLQSGMTRIPAIASSIMNSTVAIFSSKSSILAGAGNAMINGLAVGLESGRSRCISIMSSLMTSMIVSVQSRSAMFRPAGVFIVTGLAQGIASGKSVAMNAITSVLAIVITVVKSRIAMFTAAGLQIITSVAKGMMAGSGMVMAAASLAASSAVSGVTSKYFSFYSAGIFLGSGLVLGIQSMQTAAYNAGYALGQAAAQGEKDGQKSGSPSKLTIQAGKWLGDGLIIGIKSMGSKVYKAGYNLGDKTTNAISTAVSKMSNVFDINVDSEPTIRPVLDLSDIKAGANDINSLLEIQPSVGMMYNLGTINATMRTRNQNSYTEEIVSAINKLRREVQNQERKSYTINGITYDDGSGISDAIEMLIRAAKIERRV